MIDYMNVINESFEESHLWAKAQLILLVYYLYEKEIEDRLDYSIDYVALFTPPEQDIQIIKRDFELIKQKIKEGKAHELSEGDTLYLGAAPKAATSKDRRKQPNSEELAKPRAFAFKNSYMTYVLNNYVVPNKVTYEPIIKNRVVDSFEEYITNRINEYKGYSIQGIIDEFKLNYNKDTKNLGALLAYRILGIKGNRVAEFEKANIVVKTIRIENSNKIKQHMSFPAFKFKELIEETWEESTFGTYLSETRFFFVVYKFDKDGVLRLEGCQFWNIPYRDLNEEVRNVWEETKQVLINGLEITVKNNKRYNNFPGSSHNPVSHVRPHGKNSSDVDQLPDGRMYPKQCFWLNNSYILSQLNEEFLK
nr:Sau3AI family type II restriction endonuclease [Cellulosilyticum ruminicola]